MFHANRPQIRVAQDNRGFGVAGPSGGYGGRECELDRGLLVLGELDYLRLRDGLPAIWLENAGNGNRIGLIFI